MWINSYLMKVYDEKTTKLMTNDLCVRSKASSSHSIRRRGYLKHLLQCFLTCTDWVKKDWNCTRTITRSATVWCQYQNTDTKCEGFLLSGVDRHWLFFLESDTVSVLLQFPLSSINVEHGSHFSFVCQSVVLLAHLKSLLPNKRLTHSWYVPWALDYFYHVLEIFGEWEEHLLKKMRKKFIFTYNTINKYLNTKSFQRSHAKFQGNVSYTR